MKKVIYSIAAVTMAMLIASCSGKPQNQAEGTDAQSVAAGDGQKLVLDSAASVIEWQGSKIGGTHNGTLAIKSGELTIKDSALIAGSFVIDMNSIVDLDQTVEAMNKMLTGHLKSADFFDVAQYPEAKFDITSAEAVNGNDSVNYKISGNLTLKGVEKNLTFDAKITKTDNNYSAVTALFSIDRTQWGVNYGSKSVFADLKDKIVNDNIQLRIKIVAKPAQ